MRQDSGIGVLDKAVGVLHAVADSPCGLAELCERTGLPRATAHRLAAGLEVHRLLSRNGIDPSQIDLFVSHQANRRIIEAASERLGLGPDKVIINLEMYGNAPAGARIDLSLASIQRDLHLPMLPQHDAFNDALRAAQMYVILKDMIARGVRIRRHGTRSDDIGFAVG